MLTQTGCAAGEKCGNIGNIPVGNVGCAPTGTVQIGCPCTNRSPGPATGHDDCVPGAVCLGGFGGPASGVCVKICDLQLGAPACEAGTTCTSRPNLLEVNDVPAAGICGPTCDPLTQCLKTSAMPSACASIDPAMPNNGCYGFEEFSCSDVFSIALTDRAVPLSGSLNSCAPGFMPLLYEMTGSTQVLCTGLCAALEIDNTPAHINNGKGDATARAKLPTSPTPNVGDGTCDIGKKGSETSSQCRFLWPLLVDSQGDLPAVFENSPHLDTLGICIAIAHFSYDSNNDNSPDATYPDCATLPPRSAATPGAFDDAADWGCQKRLSSMQASPRNPAFGEIRIWDPARAAP